MHIKLVKLIIIPAESCYLYTTVLNAQNTCVQIGPGTHVRLAGSAADYDDL